MTIEEKKVLLLRIIHIIQDIPIPPPGREIALMKTNLDQAKLWLKESIEQDSIDKELKK
jgi:hypothetical protein